jgi:hypothetical protein
MDSAPLPDLDGLDREALKALLVAHQEELRSLAASHEDELRSLQLSLSPIARHSPNKMSNCVQAASRSSI